MLKWPPHCTKAVANAVWLFKVYLRLLGPIQEESGNENRKIDIDFNGDFENGIFNVLK